MFLVVGVPANKLNLIKKFFYSL